MDHSSLSAAADERKARLAKLKGLKRKQPTTHDDDAATTEPPRAEPSPPQEGVAKLLLSGRNYDPETRGPKLGFEAPPTLALDTPTLEEQAAEVEAQVRQRAAEEAQDDKGIDLFKLQPKKPNWDLKRNLDKRMEVLNVRTDNAIARLVRERILAAKKPEIKDGVAADGEGAGVDGLALVEGLRVREREEEEEERRERDQEDEAML